MSEVLVGTGNDTVSENGVSKIQQSLFGRKIFFDPSHVPGVSGNLDPEKLMRLSARGCYVAQEGTKVIITSQKAFQTANQVKKQLRELGLQGIGDFDISLDMGGKIIDEETEPYGYFGSYFGTPELIEKYTQRISWSEFFNNKVHFFDWMMQSGFGDIIPQTKVFSSKETLVSYLGQNKSDGSWVKAGIGASGIGSWKIGSSGEHSFTKQKLEYFDNDNKIERYFDDDGKMLNLQKGENGVLGEMFEMGYIVQGSAIGKEYSISFYVNNSGTSLITQTENITSGATHEGNRSITLPDSVKEKIQKVAIKMQETGYRGPVGFDFFYDAKTEKIAILEANPRHTGATNTSSFLGQSFTKYMRSIAVVFMNSSNSK